MSDETLVELTEEEEAALLDMLVRYARGFDVQPYEQAVAVRLIRAAERNRAERETRALVLDEVEAKLTVLRPMRRMWTIADVIAALRGQTEEGQNG